MLVKAMLASCSIPENWPPLQISCYLLVSILCTQNLPFIHDSQLNFLFRFCANSVSGLRIYSYEAVRIDLEMGLFPDQENALASDWIQDCGNH